MYSLQHDKVDPNKLYSFSLLFFFLSLILSLVFFHFFGQKVLGQRGYSYIQPVVLALGVYIAVYQIYTRQKFILIGLNHIYNYALILTAPTIVFMILILPLFWFFPAAYKMEGSYLLNVAVMILVAIIFHFRLARCINFKFILDFPLIFRSYSLGFKAFLSEYMAILMTRVDIIILKQLSTFSQLGIYTLAINFVDMINITGSMIGVVLLNKFSALKDDTASLVILRKVFVVMIAFDLFCIIGMVLLGSPIIRLLYGVQYQETYYAFLYMIPAIIGLTLGSLFNTFLWSKGFPVFTIIAPALSTLIKVFMSYLLIPKYGLYGAAMSSSVVYLLWFAMLMVWYYSSHKDQKISQLIICKEDISQIFKMLDELKNKLVERF